MRRIPERRTTMNASLDLSKYPAVMAQHPSHAVSDKYGFIPTTRIIDLLQGEGYFPTKIQQSKAIKTDRLGYQRHMVRFRHRDFLDQVAVVGVTVPELVVVNAHDGANSFQFMGGLWTFTCGNGAVVSDGAMPMIRVPHLQYKDDIVVQKVLELTREMPRLMERVTEYKSIALTKNEQVLVAEASLMVRYDDAQLAHYRVDIDKLLLPRRAADAEPTLWNTYNLLQEKLVKGGDRVITDTNQHQRKKVVGINSVKEDIRVNKALWMIMDRMAAVKTGKEIGDVQGV
jgi:hypothetical protein